MLLGAADRETSYAVPSLKLRRTRLGLYATYTEEFDKILLLTSSTINSTVGTGFSKSQHQVDGSKPERARTNHCSSCRCTRGDVEGYASSARITLQRLEWKYRGSCRGAGRHRWARALEVGN